MSGRDLIAAKIDQGRMLLAEATTIPQAKAVMAIAEAAQVYARRQKLGAECESYARELRTDAEKLLGDILRETPKNVGALGSVVTGTDRVPLKDNTPTLADLGLDKKTSARAQTLAALPDDKFAAVKSGEKTLTSVLREVRHEAKQTQPMPLDKYRVIYADPPWSYGNAGVIGETDNYGHAARHYPSMSIADLCDLPVKTMAQDDAVLFLWVTSPLLAECFAVISAWGFKYKTSFVWDKVAHNFGHYNSVRHEFLLICTRGSCTPDTDQLVDSVQTIEKTRKHSEKPEEFRRIIDSLYTRGQRIELFARTLTEGWDVWGNETQPSAA